MNDPGVFAFPARLTHPEAMSVLAALTGSLAAGHHRIDLSALCEFDSTALAVLLAARRAAQGDAQPVFLNVPDKLRRLASLYGLDGLVFDAA